MAQIEIQSSISPQTPAEKLAFAASTLRSPNARTAID
jgi:hypothetical protein